MGHEVILSLAEIISHPEFVFRPLSYLQIWSGTERLKEYNQHP